jgi:hypothetical protein
MVFQVLLHPSGAPHLWTVLTRLGLQGEMDQLIWQSRQDLVSTTPGKSVQSQVPSHWPKGSLIHSWEPPRGVPQVRNFSQMGERKLIQLRCECVCVCVNLFKAWAKFNLLLEFQLILCMLKLTFFLACLIYKTFLCVYVNIFKLVLKLLL